jgi:hypothetical protein
MYGRSTSFGDYGQRSRKQEPFLIKSLEALLLLRMLTLIALLALPGKFPQYLSDTVNSIAWSWYLLRLCWTLICKHRSAWWLMNNIQPVLLQRIRGTTDCQGCQRPNNFINACFGLSARIRESLKPPSFNAAACYKKCRCIRTSDEQEGLNIEMRLDPTTSAPGRMTIDRGHTRQHAPVRDKNL